MIFILSMEDEKLSKNVYRRIAKTNQHHVPINALNKSIKLLVKHD